MLALVTNLARDFADRGTDPSAHLTLTRKWFPLAAYKLLLPAELKVCVPFNPNKINGKRSVHRNVTS